MYLNPFKNLINTLFYPLCFHAVEGEGGGEGGDEGGNEAAPGEGGAGGANAMPEGLPESFWDAETQTVRMDTFVKSFNETKAAYSKKEDDIRAKIVAEQQQARPAEPVGYEVGELNIELPPGVNIEFRDNDTFLRTWRNIAFQSNLSQDQFMEGVRNYVTDTLADRVDVNAEREKLGENAQDRIDRVDLLLSKHLTDEQAQLFNESFMTAEGVEALESLFNGLSGTRMPDIDGMQSAGKLTREDVLEMQKDPRYWKDKDPAYHKKVSEAWERLTAQKKAG